MSVAPKRVVVVGAGLAGLATAIRLAAGIAPNEAEGEVGEGEQRRCRRCRDCGDAKSDKREPGGGEERRITSAKEHGDGAHTSCGVFIAIGDGGERMRADPPGGEDEHRCIDQVGAPRRM